MLDFTIYSYGYAEIIENTLQAIAMFRRSNFYPIIITTVALLSGLTYAMHMAAARVDEQWRTAIRRVLGMALFIHVLLLPTASMTIKDSVEKYLSTKPIDNIPLAFALPIGMIEHFGHLLTAGFEQVFSEIDGASAHSYYHYGSVFGARLQKEVLQSKVRDPEFISNMSNFIERCVILPSMIGKQFTKEDLVASEDLWALIKKEAGTFARTPMTVNGKRVNPHPKCKDAVPYFEKKFDEAIHKSIFSWSWKFKGAGKGSTYNMGSRSLNNNFKAQIRALYGKDSRDGEGPNVDSILKHNMMINSINSYRSGKYPAAKAQLQHEAGGLISGDLAEKTLTGSLAVMKVIVYGSFIFLFPLLLISGGMSKYRSWVTAAFSLALWPSLFSMLNMIIDFAYQPATIVSYSSWSTELKKFDSIASTAANLTLMIPFLSFWITRMGEGGFMHLAGSIMATANNASAALSGEKASGSRSWDNESIRNQNNDNVSSNKHDSSMQYVSAAARAMMYDGSMEMVTPGGKSLYFGGAGQSASTGESSYHLGEGYVANYQEGVRDETQIMQAEQASLTASKEKLIAQEASALHSIMQNSKTDNGYNIDTSTEEGREVAKAISEVDELNKNNDYGWKQNAETWLEAGQNTGPLKYLFGIKIGGGGKVSASNDSSQSDSQNNRLSTDDSLHARDGNSERITRTENFLESYGIDKNTQDSVRETYQESERLEKSISAHQDKIDSYNKAMDYTKSHSGEFSKDMYQDVVDAFQDKHGGSARRAYTHVSAGTEEARAVFKELTSHDSEELLSKIRNQGSNIEGSDSVASFMESNQIDSSIGSKRDDFASDNDIRTDKDNVASEISSKGSEIQDMHSKKYSSNESEYKAQEESTTKKQQERQEQIDQYEKDRIGQGRVSRGVDLGANVVTLGNAGRGIGRPSQTEDDLDIDGPIVSEYNWETGKFEPINQPTHKKFYSDSEEITSKGEGQYVNPKNKQ
jgi:hypothetical protein